MGLLSVKDTPAERCARVIGTPASHYGSPRSGEQQSWVFSWYSSVPQHKFWNSTLTKGTSSSIYIVSDSSFTIISLFDAT